MPTSSLPLNTIENQQLLQDVFPMHNLDLPLYIQLRDNGINLVKASKTDTYKKVELVVFSILTVHNFAHLLTLANQEKCTLIDINHRADRTSYRFQIDYIDNKTFAKTKEKLTAFALENHFDIALLDKAPSLNQPGLLVMDMDSTTIEIECIDEIAILAGVGKEVSEVTELAMQGKLDFAESLRARVATLEGANESILAQVGDNLPLMPGLEVLVKTLHQHNWKVAVASGGFTYFTEILKDKLNLDATQANVLEIIDGKLTGQVIGNITDAQVKADTLNRLSDKFDIDSRQTVAMGDGANDLVMMDAAHLGVAYKAKPIVLQQAASNINFSGLDCLLHWLK